MARWPIRAVPRRSGWPRALGEIEGIICDEQILKNWELFSSVASTSAGIELMHNVVIVLGNSDSSASPFVIGHGVMRDSIDSAAVIAALKSVGLGPRRDFRPDRAKPTGQYFLPRRKRPRMEACGDFATPCWTIHDIGATRHCPCLRRAGSLAVSRGPGPSMFRRRGTSGPPGGGPVAAIARL